MTLDPITTFGADIELCGGASVPALAGALFSWFFYLYQHAAREIDKSLLLHLAEIWRELAGCPERKDDQNRRDGWNRSQRVPDPSAPGASARGIFRISG